MTVELQVKVDSTSLEARFARMPMSVQVAIRGVVIRDTQQLAQLVRAKLNGQVLHKRTGKLLNSIRSETREAWPEGIYGRVWSDGSAPYAHIQEFGGVTSPHDIVAKNGQALAFMMGGRMRFFKRIHHPGSRIPARSYMASSLADMRDKIISDMKAAVTAAAAKRG